MRAEGIPGIFRAVVQQWRMDLEAFELVLLSRPGDAPDYPDEVLDRIQHEHVAYLVALRKAGHVVTNGPVTEQRDPALRGLAFYRTGSLERSRQLAEDDPAVRAGRLAVEIMTWYCPPGTMSQPGRPVTVE
jgi:uncharacterized protein YciI